VTFGLYYFKPLAPLQRFFLILASMVFYAANQPILLLLLASSIVINFTASYFVIKVNPNHRKRFAAIGVILNISILVFFKYSPLFGRSIFYAIDSVEAFLVMIPYFISQSSFELLMMLFGYSMQIFADFAGYSLIAIGIAGLFGYRLPQNFNFPYISKSFSEFWTRWHISLSSFLKEYLYFSLGGNRKGKSRIYLNEKMGSGFEGTKSAG
jgi:D-alanyl-lipoteichoic acid acyltransferase DltB (MBOAT superfamily)